MAAKKTNTILKTSEEACVLARKLIDHAKFAAIAVLEIQTGIPLVSRIAVSTDNAGNVIFLASELSSHTRAITNNPIASIMVGEPGKGDPLAHPRVTLIGSVVRIDRAAKEREALRSSYLVAHPKAKLYVDFGDFHFFRLNLQRANLNGGFGRAYELTKEDLR